MAYVVITQKKKSEGKKLQEKKSRLRKFGGKRKGESVPRVSCWKVKENK